MTTRSFTEVSIVYGERCWPFINTLSNHVPSVHCVISQPLWQFRVWDFCLSVCVCLSVYSFVLHSQLLVTHRLLTVPGGDSRNAKSMQQHHQLRCCLTTRKSWLQRSCRLTQLPDGPRQCWVSAGQCMFGRALKIQRAISWFKLRRGERSLNSHFTAALWCETLLCWICGFPNDIRLNVNDSKVNCFIVPMLFEIIESRL